MKQATLKIKNYANNVNVLNNGHRLEGQFLNIILWSFGALALLYVLFLGNMIFNIIERKSLEADARNLSNEVGTLESQYLYVSDKVDVALAESMGFKEIKDKQYAVRKSIGSLVLKSNEL